MAIQTKVGVTKTLTAKWLLAGQPGSVDGLPVWRIEPAENGVLETLENGDVKVTLSVEGDTAIFATADPIQGEVAGSLEITELLTAGPADVILADSGVIEEVVAQ